MPYKANIDIEEVYEKTKKKTNDSNPWLKKWESEDEYLTDEEQLQLELEVEKFNRQTLVMDQIHNIYKNIIEKFKQGDHILYNPNICAGLTEKKFSEWIFKNNKEVSELFR